MSDDVMTRLRVRDYCWCADLDPCQTCWERQSAADEIERLRAEHTFVERLVAGQLLSRMTELEADLAAERAEVERLRATVREMDAIAKEMHDPLGRLSLESAINYALRTERITEGGPS